MTKKLGRTFRFKMAAEEKSFFNLFSGSKFFFGLGQFFFREVSLPSFGPSVFTERARCDEKVVETLLLLLMALLPLLLL